MTHRAWRRPAALPACRSIVSREARRPAPAWGAAPGMGGASRRPRLHHAHGAPSGRQRRQLSLGRHQLGPLRPCRLATEPATAVPFAAAKARLLRRAAWASTACLARVVIANSERTRSTLIERLALPAEKVHTVYTAPTLSSSGPRGRPSAQGLARPGWDDERPGARWSSSSARWATAARASTRCSPRGGGCAASRTGTRCSRWSAAARSCPCGSGARPTPGSPTASASSASARTCRT